MLWLCPRFFLWNTWVMIQRICCFHHTWVCSIMSCLVALFKSGLESCTISIWAEAQTDYVQRWYCIWILDLVLQSLCQPSVMLIVLSWECFWEQFSRGTFLPTHLHRLTFSDPRQTFVKAHVIIIRGGSVVPANSLFSAWVQQIWKENTWRFDLSKQVWYSVHWAGTLATGVLFVGMWSST